MADYTTGTGNGGIMLIRDQGWSVEFHIQAGLSATFVGTPGFVTSTYIDGSWRLLSNVANYSNRVWRYLGAYNATYTQNVCFHIDDSGTEGFGGPTDFWQYIGRATTPPPPIPVSPMSEIGHTSVLYEFNSAGTGGSPILEWQVGYGTSQSHVQFVANGASGTVRINGLTQGTDWYFWARGRNAMGWGGWSTRLQARTLSSGRVKVAGVWREMVLYIKVSGVWREAILYEKKAGAWTLLKGN